MSKQPKKPTICKNCNKTSASVYIYASSGMCENCNRSALFSNTNITCKQCNRSLPSANITSVGICVRCMRDQSTTESKAAQPQSSTQQRKSILESVVGSISGLFSTNNNSNTQNNSTNNNNNSNSHITSNKTIASKPTTTSTLPPRTTYSKNNTSRDNTSTSTTTTTTTSTARSPYYSHDDSLSTHKTKEKHDTKMKMCLDCGAVRTDIPIGSDVCAACRLGPSGSSEKTKELIEFVEEMGFDRPVILAAIMKLQLDNQVINTQSVIGAIGELLAPVEPHSSSPSPPSSFSSAPPSKLSAPSAPPSVLPSSFSSPPSNHTSTTTFSCPPASKLSEPSAPPLVLPPNFSSPPAKHTAPSAPPLHAQDTSGSDSDRTKCKICYENDINTVLLPCAHRVVCLSCSTPLQSCPICRVSISQVIKTYDT